MSKVLIIQPDRMLQQAFMLALFPEHDLQMLSMLPDAPPSGFDAAIIDASTLQECGSMTTGHLRMIQTWKLPVVWVESDAGPSSSDQLNVVRVQRPVTKVSLLNALGECLRPMRNEDDGGSSKAQNVLPPTPAKSKKVKAPAPAIKHGKFIELVDVVEEGMVTATAMTRVKNKV